MNAGLACRRDIHVVADSADTADHLHDLGHELLIRREVLLFLIYRPGGFHQESFIRRKHTVYFLSDKRHERMHQLECVLERLTQHPQGTVCRLRICIFVVNTVLRDLDIPVAELIPDKIMNFLHCYAEFVFIHILCHIFRDCVCARDNPPVNRHQIRGIRLAKRNIVQIHQNKTGCIPHLVGEITARLHAFSVKTHVVAGSIACHKCQAKRIRAIFLNHLERIDSVSERLAHFPSEGIADQAVDQHRVER